MVWEFLEFEQGGLSECLSNKPKGTAQQQKIIIRVAGAKRALAGERKRERGRGRASTMRGIIFGPHTRGTIIFVAP